jgi:Insulin-induced protein (INSIG)
MRTSSWLPSTKTVSRLLFTGTTVGPLVDSLHNQCLLEYDLLPISLSMSTYGSMAQSFCSSWVVPPLLGIAYVVLGGILPRFFQSVMDASSMHRDAQSPVTQERNSNLRTRAGLAVTTTAFIIKLSELLETHHWWESNANIAILLLAALSQWFLLDRTPVALIVASISSIGGPLCELPFVAHHVWHYLPESGDYFPLNNFAQNGLLEALLGPGYNSLALSGITGPCYFAVTMDAIALARWFEEE